MIRTRPCAWLLAVLLAVLGIAAHSTAVQAAAPVTSTPSALTARVCAPTSVDVLLVVVVATTEPSPSTPVGPKTRVWGSDLLSRPPVGLSTAVLPDGIRGLTLQLRQLVTGITVYVNGDPVNLSDPNGHNPCKYEGTGAGGCTSSENQALAASDRGADTSGPWFIGPAKNGRRTYSSPTAAASALSPASGGTCAVGPGSFVDPTGLYGTASTQTYGFCIPKHPGGGMIVINLFIQDQKACAFSLGALNPPDAILCGSGDDRGFEPLADTSHNRVTVSLNLDTGEGLFVSNPTCKPHHTDCQSAFPITDSSSIPFLLGPTSFRVAGVTSPDGSTTIGLELHATQSIYGPSPSIDERHLIQVDSHGRIFGLYSGDYFPSVEIRRITDSGDIQSLFNQQQGGLGGLRLALPFGGNSAAYGSQ